MIVLVGVPLALTKDAVIALSAMVFALLTCAGGWRRCVN